MAGTMIEAKAPTASIRRAYDLYSYFYGRLIAPFERGARMLALERAAVQPQDRVLEVAVGPGSTLVEILKLVESANVVQGVDLSPKMLAKARRRAEAAGHSNVDLREASASDLPFPDDSFDVLYNSYMLDLIPLQELPVVLNEFKRVLKPGGRLALVSMSKRDPDRRTWTERVYSWLPAPLVPYLMGGCRPVLMEGPVRDAGFTDVQREFVGAGIPSEVISARKPG